MADVHLPGHPRKPSPPVKRTRRRKLLSCYDCRRRKLQCDRALPACGRCTKAGQASDCLYIESASDLPSSSRVESTADKATSRKNEATVTSQGGDAQTRLAYQNRRIRELEDALANQSRDSSNAPLSSLQLSTEADVPGTPVSVSEAPVRAAIRGGSFQTQSHGRTYTASVLDDPELQKFNCEIYDHFSAIARMRRELRDEELIPSSLIRDRIVSDADLRSLLPPKPEADELVHLYLDHYGKMFHVLYMPTFWEAYALIWTDTRFADVHFVAVVLAMIASVSCLRPMTPSSLEARLRADAMIDSLDTWLTQRRTKRSVLSDLQLRVLLAIAKQACARKFKRNWMELGLLLQLCIHQGLHTDSEWPGIEHPTPIENELRRRIWAAVVELELQAAFDRGMVSAIPPSDARSPTNVHDQDLALQPVLELGENVVASEGFTRVTCLVTSFHSVRTRSEVNRLLNTAPNHSITFHDVKRYTDDLQHHLQTVLDLFRSQDPADIPESMRILQLSLRQYILILNISFISEAKAKSEKDFSRMMCLQQAVEIMRVHESLSRPSCALALELFRADQVRAALSVCQVASQVCTGPDKDIALSAWANSVAADVVPVVKARLKEKVVNIGREQRHLWCVLVVEAYLKSKQDPTRRLLCMQEAVDGMSDVHNGMLAVRAGVSADSQFLELPLDFAFDGFIDAFAEPYFSWNQ